MSCVSTCDICGREEREIDCGDIDHFKVKKEFHSWWDHGWERIDICTDCLRKIRKAVRNKNKEERSNECNDCA